MWRSPCRADPKTTRVHPAARQLRQPCQVPIVSIITKHVRGDVATAGGRLATTLGHFPCMPSRNTQQWPQQHVPGGHACAVSPCQRTVGGSPCPTLPPLTAYPVGHGHDARLPRPGAAPPPWGLRPTPFCPQASHAPRRQRRPACVACSRCGGARWRWSPSLSRPAQPHRSRCWPGLRPPPPALLSHSVVP